MNGNRMKYTSTPAFGLGKRGLFTHKEAVKEIPDVPDFSQIPTQQTAGSVPVSAPVSSTPVSTPIFTQQNGMGAAVQPTTLYQNAQKPFAAAATSIYTLPQQQTTVPFFQPSAQKIQPFSGRAQGFVPVNGTQVQTPVQSFPPSSPFGGVQLNPTIQPVQPMQQVPLQSSEPVQQLVSKPTVPENSGAQNASFYPEPPAVSRTAPENRAWSVLLFVLIPALFLCCIFFSEKLPVVSVLYTAFCVIGLAVMWFKKLFTGSTRIVLSMVYAALAIVAISMLNPSAVDTTTTSNDTPVAVASSQTTAPQAQDLLQEVIVTPSPAPASTKSEAEIRLEAFMNCWADNDRTTMLNYIQPSWANAQSDPATSLFNVLANRTAKSFVIEEVSGTDEDNSRTVTMRATIDKNNNKGETTYRFMVMMVKEGGIWYVNPNSLATNEEVETAEDDVVVNNKNSTTGLQTEAPRTFVTEPPSADTVLYYNENGGNYYHLDPYCSAVNEKYLPLTGTFLYRDLATKKSELGLSPCLKCKAPTSVLSSTDD